MAWRFKRLIRSFASRLRPDPWRRAIYQLGLQQSITIVQIGAFVGDSFNDPLFRFIKAISTNLAVSYTVVLVEPVQEHFGKLKKNYADVPGIIFENVAIANESGERDFYHLGVDPTEFGFPDWLAQLGSLEIERTGALWISYEKNPEFQQFLRTHQVISRIQCLTLHDLMERHRISEIDLLQIDAEGYDYEILKSIDFSTWSGPRLINYERVLLLDQEDECRAMLKAAGYKLALRGQDTLATLRQSSLRGALRSRQEG